MLLLKFLKEDTEYSVYGKSISICPEQPDPIRIKDPEIYKGKELLTNFGENFHGHHFDAKEAAQSVIRAFISHDKTLKFRQVLKYITVFSNQFFEKDISLRGRYTTEDGKEHSRWIPFKYFGENILPLQLVDSDDCAYYSDGDEFIVIRADGSLASDYEFLYENSMLEALEKGGCKYKSEETKAIVLA